MSHFVTYPTQIIRYQQLNIMISMILPHTPLYFHIVTTNNLFEVTVIVYYVPRHIMRVITRRATMPAGDRSRVKISPASIVSSLVITRIVCIGTYSILCDSGVYTSFYAYTRI